MLNDSFVDNLIWDRDPVWELAPLLADPKIVVDSLFGPLNHPAHPTPSEAITESRKVEDTQEHVELEHVPEPVVHALDPKGKPQFLEKQDGIFVVESVSQLTSPGIAPGDANTENPCQVNIRTDMLAGYTSTEDSIRFKDSEFTGDKEIPAIKMQLGDSDIFLIHSEFEDNNGQHTIEFLTAPRQESDHFLQEKCPLDHLGNGINSLEPIDIKLIGIPSTPLADQTEG